MSGGGAMNGVGGDGVSGLGNGGGGSGPLRTIYRREPQLDLDFLTPEGLLGQSMTRRGILIFVTKKKNWTRYFVRFFFLHVFVSQKGHAVS